MMLPTLTAMVLSLALARDSSVATPIPSGAGFGSLTVMSRPSGASFRLMGEQVIIGRTPIVLRRGLSGRYRLESLEPGYNRWRRTFQLNGAIADSVWMTLSKKSAAAAGARSLLIPGWGQGYSSRPAACAFWLSTAALVGAAAGTSALIYEQRWNDWVDASNAAAIKPTAATIAARQRASDRLDQARNWRTIAVSVAGGWWGLNFLDAIVRFPRIRAGQLGLEVVPAGPVAVSHRLAPGAMVRLRARF